MRQSDRGRWPAGLVAAAVAVAACVAGPAPGTRIDLGPREGWHTQGPVTVRDDGRISLTRDGRGLAWKRVVFDVEEYPILLVRTAQTLPRLRWSVVVERGDPVRPDADRGVRLLDKFAEEGGFVVALPRATGWSGRVSFTLMIVLEGHARDWVELADLEAVRLTDAVPSPPRLADPAEGAVASRPALHFSWHQAANAVAYDLEVSSRPDFAERRSVRVDAPYLADRLPYLPEDDELLGPGRWFWRVRAVNVAGRAGPWSLMRSFSIQVLPAPREPARVVSAEHPLVILLSGRQQLTARWDALPQWLKPYTVLRIEELPAESLEAGLAVAQRHRIPVLIQASGPHDYYGRVASRITLSEIERIFTEFPVVAGVYICEQAFRVAPATNSIMMRYAERLIPLAAAYGKVVVWADGHWGRNLWIDVGLHASLLDVFRAHPRHFFPVWKMNGSLTTYAVHSAVLGLWLSGAAANWGVQPERWYWYEAGLGKLGEHAWFKEGTMADFPPSFYGQMILLGLSSGASVYSFEPPDDIWAADGGPAPVAQGVIFPLLSEIIAQRAIPERAAILGRVRAAYVADSVDSRWALDYGSMRVLYEATYGVERPFQMIPSSTRAFPIPIVPGWTPRSALATFPVRLGARDLRDASAVGRRLTGEYRRSDRGDAWTIRLGGLAIVMNARENRDGEQGFDVPIEGDVTAISGRVGPNAYILALSGEDGLRMQLNGRSGRRQVVELSAGEPPRCVATSPRSALVRSSWDAGARRLSLEFVFGEESVQLVVRGRDC